MEKCLKTLLRFGKVAIHQRPSPGPLSAPLQRTHHAVRVPGGKPGLPRVHPFGIEVWHILSLLNNHCRVKGSAFNGQLIAFSSHSTYFLATRLEMLQSTS